MTVTDFTDDRIFAVMLGASELTAEERAFLISDTVRFEECTSTEDELASLADPQLMSAAYGVWADYVRDMF